MLSHKALQLRDPVEAHDMSWAGYYWRLITDQG